MANQKYFLRSLAIIQCINEYDYPSQKKILEELNQKGYLIKTRAFEREKKSIDEMFGIKIKYDPFLKGYYIENEFDDDFNSGKARELINLFSSIKIAGSNKNVLSFEQRKVKGTELMVSIIDAINNRRVLQFTYQKYFEKTSTDRTGEPYMLKESLGRWYLIAKDRKDNRVKAFGLDRIGVMYPITGSFSMPKDLNIEELYKNALGVTNVDNVHEIIIDVFGVDAKYLESYPLHHSQELISKTELKTRYKLKVAIAKDLIMEIMKYQPNIEVIEPLVLREEIFKNCKEASMKNKSQEK